MISRAGNANIHIVSIFHQGVPGFPEKREVLELLHRITLLGSVCRLLGGGREGTIPHTTTITHAQIDTLSS